MNLILKAFIFSLNFYLIVGNGYNQLFLRGAEPPQPPKPTPEAIECLSEIAEQLNECRQEAIVHWNITDKSPIKDICCAEWQLVDCGLSAAQAKCSPVDYSATKDYVNDLTAYINDTECQQYPKGSAQCTIQVLSEALFYERPPLPGPTVVDCLTQFSRRVARTCAIEARIKWNITRRTRDARSLCCATWDDIDCLDEVVKIRCPSQEVRDTEAYFNTLEKWAAANGCGNYAYHTKNCSQTQMVDDWEEKSPFIPLPNYPNIHRDTSDEDGNRRTSDNTYFYFVLNYLLTAFPHLFHWMMILAFILVTMVVIQCVIISRQVKHDRLFAEIMPHFQGYRKV